MYVYAAESLQRRWFTGARHIDGILKIYHKGICMEPAKINNVFLYACIWLIAVLTKVYGNRTKYAEIGSLTHGLKLLPYANIYDSIKGLLLGSPIFCAPSMGAI